MPPSNLRTVKRIDSFDFAPGRQVARKYEIVRRLGSGWEGEVYMVRELATGIERAAKFYYPHRNLGDRVLRFYARKLHRLEKCSILIRYRTQETITFRRVPVTCLVSDYVEGVPLFEFIRRQPGRRLSVFEGLHLLYALASGVECFHRLGEYHGDLHDENILVRRYGLGFEVKLLDMFRWSTSKAANIHADVCDLIRVFYDAIGGRRRYTHQPAVAKEICCGLKRSLILNKYRNAGQLRYYLENLEWGGNGRRSGRRRSRVR
ncbi:MAG: protein kinase [Candidatus Eisenbacteria bacterium]|nr:protein kinase [Candidatus Eisenbacteria bacterium]